MIDQVEKHYRQRRVLGVKVYYADGTIRKITPTLVNFRNLSALGVVFIVLFFEEQYRIWLPEENREALFHYVRVIPEDVTIADHFWLEGDGTMGDHYRYGLIDSVPLVLDPAFRKLGQRVDDQAVFNSMQNATFRDNVWV